MMADMLLMDRMEELWLLIDHQHLGYLQSEERRGDQRKRLETYMREFLHLAPHDRKFRFPETADVLRRSVAERDDFSGQRASRAWAALAKYADNLIRMPWRKEFREIKLYCGFYKHEVEDGLVDAELMFEAMGYQHVGHATMALPGPLDPDRVINVSKDAMMAELECGIMQKVWTAMNPCRITWAQVLDYRENHVGTPEQSVRGLTYYARSRYHQEQANSHRQRASYAGVGCYDNHTMHHPLLHTQPQIPSYQRYAQIVSPHQVVPPTTYAAHYNHPLPVLRPQDLYPVNGFHYTPPHVHHNSHNGYAHHQGAYGIPSTVPTAQLIELETSPLHAPHHQPQFTYPLPEPIRTAEFPSSKAKDDGAGSWENWDYVYKSLETHGYKKEANRDLPNASTASAEPQLSDRLRGINLARTSTSPRRSDAKARTEGDGASRNRLSKNSIELEDAVPKHRLSKNSLDSEVDKNRKSKQSSDSEYKVSKALIGSGGDNFTNYQAAEIEVRGRQNKLLTESEFVSRVGGDDVGRGMRRSPEPPRPSAVSFDSGRALQESPEPPRHASVTLEVGREIRAPEVLRPNVVTLDVSPSFLRDVSPVVELPPEEKWECATCTYLNAARMNACEMCSKSRRRGEIKPQPCGGQECPNCTFVNDPGKNFCAVCSSSLKDSPTYI